MSHFRVISRILPFMAALAALAPPAGASADELNHYELILGLKDPAQRTNAGADALRQRVRERFVAARIEHYTLRTDRLHHEVVAKVQTRLSETELLDLVTARGQVEVLPVDLDDEILRSVKGELPKGVALDWEETRGKGDLFLTSASQEALRASIERIALANHRILGGRDSGKGPRYRSFLVSRRARPVRGDSLRAVKIESGIQPNFHTVTTYWSTKPSGDPETSDVVELTAAAKGGVIVLVIDGRVESSAPVVDPASEGEIRWRMPEKSAEEQYATAQKIAGKMASGPHPCDIVVISSKTSNR